MIGVDVENITRFETSKFDMYARKLLSNSENEIFSNLDIKKKQRYIATRFCAKEAIFKALGIGISTIKFSDISILNNEEGKPIVVHPFIKVEISISYCDNTVTVVALSLTNEQF